MRVLYALWTDFDNDGWTDLIVTGEWMPICFYKNEEGRLKNITSFTGIENVKGWWNSIAAGDFDNDGDIDYIAGNLGTNTYYRADKQYPMRIYAGDFAKNNNYVAIPSLYLNDSVGVKTEYPAQTRDDIVDQLPALKKKFLTYKMFARAEMKDLLDQSTFQSSYKLECNYMQTAYIENKGSNHFEVHALPWNAQVAPLYGIVVDDFDNDGNLDFAATGNDYGTEVSIGRYDAMKGLVMKGDGKGSFKFMPMPESGVYIPGNGKALVKLKGGSDDYFIAASQNKGVLKLFHNKTKSRLLSFLPGDKYAVVTFRNGKKRKEEMYYGSSFLSQSASFVNINVQVATIEITNNKGATRKYSF